MNLIVCVDRNWNIGCGGRLLVSIPADMKFFKEMTMGKTVIMGRKTLESFPKKQPLKGRRNIVITRDPSYEAPGAVVVHSFEEARAAASDVPEEEAFVIGGGEIYAGMLPYCGTAYVTKIDYAYESDTAFPDLDADPEWELTEESEEQTYFDLLYVFDIYRRR